MQYATAADYAAYTGISAPADVDRRLERASERIDELLMGAVYAVDADERPTDPKVADALRRATCAQAAWTLAVGDEYGTASAFNRVEIGSVKLQRADSAAGTAPRHAPDAASILRMAGLLPGIVIDGSRW
ncbi:hypothetical protein Ppa06_58220 [Planomonospora parontospora subsp. parontospora]|uniref:Head-to-tail adaptor n=2 Tax=Planomonospora parontospora TaxID=58119 RepID=A0AA37BLS0_9ACTN|nr:hypothetical protein [Planomonospora parontospora]GGK90259.1 hypothetical protein GCM10010126_57090 [Planomonospora parontospora]GII12024.1 hypothetical protein Ppa06_58220 [Planomonospora parontospora subsp. parontospora]